MRKLWAFKAKRWVRFWWRITVRDSLSPVFNRQGLYRLLQIPVFLFLVNLAVGAGEMERELLLWWAAKLAVLLTIPLFVLVNTLLAPFRVWKEERDKGRWFDSRFVYHQPQTIFTILVSPADNDRVFNFTANDAEPNSLVYWKVEIDGAAKRTKAMVVIHPNQDIGNWDIYHGHTGSVRVAKDRAMYLRIHCLPETDATIVRVQILSWEM